MQVSSEWVQECMVLMDCTPEQRPHDVLWRRHAETIRDVQSSCIAAMMYERVGRSVGNAFAPKMPAAVAEDTPAMVDDEEDEEGGLEVRAMMDRYPAAGSHRFP